MPNSFLWIGLVVVWLFVLVPMLVNNRPRIRQTSDAALATRVLHRGDERPVQRGPAAGHRSDPYWQPEPDHYGYDAEDLVDTHAEEDEFDGERAPVGEYVPARRGRGGFDPEADAIAREARYAFRQRPCSGWFSLDDHVGGARADHLAADVVGFAAASWPARRLPGLSAPAGPDRAGDPSSADGASQPLPARGRVPERRRTPPHPGPAAALRVRSSSKWTTRTRHSITSSTSTDESPCSRPTMRRLPGVSRPESSHSHSVAADSLLGAGGLLEFAERIAGSARGCGAVGSALRSHRRGQGFDSPQLHHNVVIPRHRRRPWAVGFLSFCPSPGTRHYSNWLRSQTQRLVCATQMSSGGLFGCFQPEGSSPHTCYLRSEVWSRHVRTARNHRVIHSRHHTIVRSAARGDLRVRHPRPPNPTEPRSTSEGFDGSHPRILGSPRRRARERPHLSRRDSEPRPHLDRPHRDRQRILRGSTESRGVMRHTPGSCRALRRHRPARGPGCPGLRHLNNSWLRCNGIRVMLIRGFTVSLR